MAEDKKPSRTELTELKTRLVRALLLQGSPHGEIKRIFAKQFDLKPRTAEGFITGVYEDMRKDLELPPEQRKAISQTRWLSIYADKKQPMQVRCRALENIDKIEGNHAPTKQATTDASGNDLPPDTTRRLTLQELDAELAKFDQGTGTAPEAP